MDLRIEPEDLNKCVQCGLCLPHCPTYRVTADESMSPRGRIALMRAVQNDGAPLTAEVLRSFDTCVQCRGCEAACPSGVPYGHLMESAREALADADEGAPRWLKAGLSVLGRPTLLRTGSSALAVASRLRLVPKRFGLPNDLPIKREPHHTSGDDVWLFTGCVMDVWQRDVHHATRRVIEAAGFGVRSSGDAAPCCGALHTHAGIGDEARMLATRTMEALDGDAPIVVDSAGCGAAMKEYGHLLGTEEAKVFSARVFDAHEFLAAHLDRLPSVEMPLELTVAVQDPCHLRHVQRVHLTSRDVLRPFVRDLVEIEDDGICCGAGGAYSLLQPDLSTQIRERKLAHVPDGASVIASANPGCSMHLAAAGLRTVHPMQIVDAALRGTPLPDLGARNSHP
ncbi:MAG: (Fe-S)-binding protein [Actinomycetia bacterium]|nr:(Fe-S)-binding protein [Actinomycetes bacterium]